MVSVGERGQQRATSLLCTWPSEGMCLAPAQAAALGHTALPPLPYPSRCGTVVGSS